MRSFNASIGVSRVRTWAERMAALKVRTIERRAALPVRKWTRLLEQVRGETPRQ